MDRVPSRASANLSGKSVMKEFDVVVCGGGIAGLSAALFFARTGVTVAVFDRGESSLNRVSVVHNYLGFPDGVGGAELVALCRRHAESAGAVVVMDDVREVRRNGNRFEVAASAPYSCRYFILASNKRTDIARSLGLELGGHGGRFVAVDAQGRTAAERIYAVGRITGAPSQAIVSAGDGARVAIGIIEEMRGGYYVDHDN